MIHFIKFKVFGHVQGVYFRKYTKEKAETLNICGYVKNDNCENKKNSSVSGVLESNDLEKINLMINWLKNDGSPKSKILDFKILENKKIDKHIYNDFQIHK